MKAGKLESNGKTLQLSHILMNGKLADNGKISVIKVKRTVLKDSLFAIFDKE